MDFGSLLHVAQKNEKNTKKEIKYYSTKFEPPKKEERSSKQLSVNIKKFLARKEQEERKKTLEAKTRREELLALRSQDKKATRRVSVMLKRTKSANKSVIEDAVDNDNTAVTLTGPSQPDEDDYGYVSQEASAFYNKMVAKYNNMPDEPKFSLVKKNTNVNLNGTKDRVRAALLKEQEEALLPHKRKRKHKIEYAEQSELEPIFTKETEEEKKPFLKPKPKPAPPPMNFQELLKIAEKKQFEPIVIETKKKSEEVEQPMTKKQKREYEKEKAWREQREKRLHSNENSEKSIKNTDKSSIPPPNKIPKLNNTQRTAKNSNTDEHSSKTNTQKSSPQNISKKNDVSPMEHRSNLNKISKLQTELEKGKSAHPQSSIQLGSRTSEAQYKKLNTTKNGITKNDMKSVPRKELSKSSLTKTVASSTLSNKISGIQNSTGGNKQTNTKQVTFTDIRLKQNLPSNSKIKHPSASDSQPKKNLPPDVKSKPSIIKPKQYPPVNVKPKQLAPTDLKPKQFPSTDMKSKQFPSADMKPKPFSPVDMKSKQLSTSDPKPKQFPPPDLKPKQFPPTDVRRSKDVKKKTSMGHKRRILDDDSEYDSEMDDFIDDGPQGGEDYSRYISEIFGYDKSKYRDIDEDDNNMESSFSQMMKEEYISSKIGIMEDLEDMRQEALEKKQKAKRKKSSM